jgi:2-phospho-L-lactate guanylyltransferase
MQGTVATFDPDTRAVSVLLDDGTLVEVPPVAFEASGLRLLRFGQRLTLVRDASGQVVRLHLPTM